MSEIESKNENGFTVGELIDALSIFDKDIPVVTESWDCVGEYFNVFRIKKVKQSNSKNGTTIDAIEIV